MDKEKKRHKQREKKREIYICYSKTWQERGKKNVH